MKAHRALAHLLSQIADDKTTFPTLKLTKAKLSVKRHSVEDARISTRETLALQSTVKYGCLGGGENAKCNYKRMGYRRPDLAERTGASLGQGKWLQGAGPWLLGPAVIGSGCWEGSQLEGAKRRAP